MSELLWAAVVIAGLVALLAPMVLRPVLTGLGVLDVPNHRSSHAAPTLRGGGLASLLGFASGGVVAIIALPRESAEYVTLVTLAAIAISLVGFVEDLRGVRAMVRAGLQFLVGAAFALALSLTTGASLIWLPLAALFFAANVNFVNFMDGVNGITGLNGMVAGLAYAALGAVSSLPWLTVLGALTAIVFAAFLPWNLTPPGMFLGDVGSYLLGGALGAIAIAALMSGFNPIEALAPLTICWADTVSTLLGRLRRGEHVFEAHRSHVYQKLTRSGLSHVAVAVMVAFFTLVASLVGHLVARDALAAPLSLAVLAVIAGAYLGLPVLLNRTQALQVATDSSQEELNRI